MLAHSRAALEQLERGEAEVAAIARGEAGQLRFGPFPTATACFVAEAVRVSRARHPDVELFFRDAEPYEQVPELENLRSDRAVMFGLDGWPSARSYEGELVSATEDVVHEPLFDDPYSLALPANHAPVSQHQVALGQIADEVIIGSPRDCAPWGIELTRLWRFEGFEPRFRPDYHTHDFQAVQALVAAGQGLSLLPELSLGSARSDIVIRPLEPAPARHVKVGFPPTSYRSAACDALDGPRPGPGQWVPSSCRARPATHADRLPCPAGRR